jgi:hypothetical protein
LLDYLDLAGRLTDRRFFRRFEVEQWASAFRPFCDADPVA